MPALAISLLGSGCDENLAACAGDAEAAIQIGTGELEFEAIEDGDTVQLVLGPQGGFHLLGSLRVRGLVAGDPDNLEAPENPTGQFEVWLGEADLVISSPFTQGLDPLEDCDEGWEAETVGRFAVLDVDNDDTLDGQTVTFAVDLQTPDGLLVRDERQVLVEPHPLNF